MAHSFGLLVITGVLAAAGASAQETAVPPEDVPRFEDQTVVSVDRKESTLVNSSLAVSVLSSDAITSAPAQNVGDLVRGVVGVNVVQTSARDFNITARQGTSTLSSSQLALVDGRSIYLDFFGMILWDFVPTNPGDIKQIEVVRGPASAVWGANALTGVINIITKTPREAPGGSLTFTGGLFSRDAGSGAGQAPGQSLGASGSWAAAPGERWSYRVSGGYYRSDALPRPAGTIPRGTHPSNEDLQTGGSRYPVFPNQGTSQPRFDLRVDQVLARDGVISYSAGMAGTQGIVHTGIGPFDLQNGSFSGYGRVAFKRGGLRLSAFTNLMDAKAPNLLSVDAITGRPLRLDLTTQTYDVEAGHSAVLGGRHILSYGASARRNAFEISIAPEGKNRSELGAYLQDELHWRRFRFTVGGRVDKFGILPGLVFSPRLAAMFKPSESQSLRVSFNRAFRAPSVINNYLDVPIKFAELPLGLIDPRLAGRVFAVPTRSMGSEVAQSLNPGLPDLEAESLSAYEVGYTARLRGRTMASAAFYVNDTDRNINFTTTPAAIMAAGLPAFFTSTNPPPGWPLPPAVLDVLAQRGIRLPATFAYLNLGPIRNRGLELSLDHSFSSTVAAFANYSWQDEPEPCDGNVWRTCTAGPGSFPREELTFPPTHRFNLGLSVNRKRWLANVSVNHVSEAFWTDVLTPDLHGATSAYTLVGASLGLKWHGGKIVTTLKGTNLANQDIQQHIFGDILKRAVVAEVRLLF